MHLTLRPFGDRAILAETRDEADARALSAALSDPPRGVTEIVPAARTVLVMFTPREGSAAVVSAWIRAAAQRAATGARPAATGAATLLVRYDGADLADVAADLGSSVEALVRAHRAATWTVAFTGFAPGFAYLTAPEWGCRVPRLATPRTRVPAGAVGLADAYCGAYPRSTPGGWQLIGTTTSTLFDPHATPPTPLAPGVRVQFQEAS